MIRLKHIIRVALSAFFAGGIAFAQEKPKDPAIPIANLNRTSPVDFEKEILPIFRANCLACHNRTTSKADLILETPADIRKGGESGPAVLARKSANSLLLGVASHIRKPFMPPKENKVAAVAMTGEELALVKLWIDQGATGEVSLSKKIDWQPFPESLNPIYAVAVSPDGQYAAAGRANQIHVYHLPTQQLVASLSDPKLAAGIYKSAPAHRDLVGALAFSPDSAFLVSGAYGEVKVWKRPAISPRGSIAGLASASIGAMTSSSDGKWLAVVADQSQINLCDASGKVLKSIAAHTPAVKSIKFSADGTKLASCGSDKTVRVWSVPDGAEISKGTAATDLNAVVWTSADKLITGGADGQLKLWQLPAAAGQPLSILSKDPAKPQAASPITAMDLLPGATPQIVTGGADGAIRIWSAADLKPSTNAKGLNHGSPIVSLAARADGKMIVSAGGNVAKLWDPAKTTTVAELRGDRTLAQAVSQKQRTSSLAGIDLAYHKSTLTKAEAMLKSQEDRVKKANDGRTAATKPVADADAARKKAMTEKAAADKAVADLAPEAKAATDALANADKVAKDAEEAYAKAAKAKPPLPAAELEKLKTIAKTFTKLAAEAKAALAKISAEKTKSVNDKAAATAKALTDAEANYKRALMAQANADNELVLAQTAVKKAAEEIAVEKSAITATDAEVKKADADLAAAKAAATGAEKPIRALAMHPSLPLVATVGDSQKIHLWSAETGAPIDAIPAAKSPLNGVTFLKDSVLAGSATAEASAWNLAGDWQLTATLGTGDAASPIIDRVNALVFSPDGQTLAIGAGDPSRSGQISLFSVPDFKPAKDFRDIHSDVVLSLDFSRDGRYLASGGADKFVRVLDLSTGKLARSFEGHTHHVLGVSWKADGRTLISGSADTGLKVWDFVSGDRKGNIKGGDKEVTSVRYVGLTDQVLLTLGEGIVKTVGEGGGGGKSFATSGDFVYSSAVTPDGGIIVSGGEDGTLRVWTGDAKVIAAFGAAKPAK